MGLPKSNKPNRSVTADSQPASHLASQPVVVVILPAVVVAAAAVFVAVAVVDDDDDDGDDANLNAA